MIPGGKQEHTFHLLFKEMCIGLSAVLRPFRTATADKTAVPPWWKKRFFTQILKIQIIYSKLFRD